MKHKHSLILIVFFVLAVVVLFVAASYFRRDAIPYPYEEVTSTPKADTVPTEQEVFSLSGIVRGVYGGTIDLEVRQGAAGKPDMRFISLASDTQFALLDTSRVDEAGNAYSSSITLDEIRTGDPLTAYSKENIKNQQRFIAYNIEVLRN